MIPLDYVRIAAFASFILFGFWTLRGDTLEGEDKRFNFSPFWTVAVAFFLAEMGDKTQLTTVALAAEYQSIFAVWFGTTTGMLIADAIGIGVGIVLGKKIPERTIKWTAAFIFIFFGLSGLYELLPNFICIPFSSSAEPRFSDSRCMNSLWAEKGVPAMPAPLLRAGGECPGASGRFRRGAYQIHPEIISPPP